MKEFKGTKEWGKNEGGDNLSIDIILGNDTTISIDRTYRYTGEIVATREEMIANAQLISKAPELLEAISHCLDIMEDLNVPEHVMETYGNAMMNYRHLIQEVIELKH